MTEFSMEHPINDWFWNDPKTMYGEDCPFANESPHPWKRVHWWTSKWQRSQAITTSSNGAAFCRDCKRFFKVKYYKVWGNAQVYDRGENWWYVPNFFNLDIKSSFISVEDLMALRMAERPDLEKIIALANSYQLNTPHSPAELDVYCLLWGLVNALRLSQWKELKPYMRFYHMWFTSAKRGVLEPTMPWHARFYEQMTLEKLKTYTQMADKYLTELRNELNVPDFNDSMYYWISALDGLRAYCVAEEKKLSSAQERAAHHIPATLDDVLECLQRIDHPATVNLDELRSEDWATLRSRWKAESVQWQRKFIMRLSHASAQNAIPFLIDIIENGEDISAARAANSLWLYPVSKWRPLISKAVETRVKHLSTKYPEIHGCRTFMDE